MSTRVLRVLIPLCYLSTMSTRVLRVLSPLCNLSTMSSTLVTPTARSSRVYLSEGRNTYFRHQKACLKHAAALVSQMTGT